MSQQPYYAIGMTFRARDRDLRIGSTLRLMIRFTPWDGHHRWRYANEGEQGRSTIEMKYQEVVANQICWISGGRV